MRGLLFRKRRRKAWKLGKESRPRAGTLNSRLCLCINFGLAWEISSKHRVTSGHWEKSISPFTFNNSFLFRVIFSSRMRGKSGMLEVGDAGEFHDWATKRRWFAYCRISALLHTTRHANMSPTCRHLRARSKEYPSPGYFSLTLYKFFLPAMGIALGLFSVTRRIDLEKKSKIIFLKKPSSHFLLSFRPFLNKASLVIYTSELVVLLSPALP
jgi:hypothetical protein